MTEVAEVEASVEEVVPEEEEAVASVAEEAVVDSEVVEVELQEEAEEVIEVN